MQMDKGYTADSRILRRKAEDIVQTTFLKAIMRIDSFSNYY